MHGQLKQLPFKGESMLPLISSGDEILFTDEVDQIRTGDVLFFKDSESSEFIVHRVLQVSPLCTKGDWSCRYEYIRKENVFGIVKGIKSKGATYYFSSSINLMNLWMYLSKALLTHSKVKRQLARLLLICLGPFMKSKAKR